MPKKPTPSPSASPTKRQSRSQNPERKFLKDRLRESRVRKPCAQLRCNRERRVSRDSRVIESGGLVHRLRGVQRRRARLAKTPFPG